MKKILKFIGLGVAVMLYASSSFAQGADTVAITLKDAWDIALSKSLTVMVADKEIEKTGYEKKGAYASLSLTWLSPEVTREPSRNRQW